MESTARTELEEEAGLLANEIKNRAVSTWSWSSPQVIHFPCYGSPLETKPRNCRKDANVVTRTTQPMIKSGEVQDSLTIAGLDSSNSTKWIKSPMNNQKFKSHYSLRCRRLVWSYQHFDYPGLSTRPRYYSQSNVFANTLHSFPCW